MAQENPNGQEEINHPSHYGGDTPYEAIKVMAAWMTKEELVGFCIGNAIKYLCRWRHKGGVSALKKAKFYLDYIIARIENDDDFKGVG